MEEKIKTLANRSVEIILEYQTESGAYPACPFYENYKFCWFRDGSFIADAMSRAGQVESAEKFFRWGARIITARRAMIQSGGTLDARYTYDGEESRDEWSHFQLDGYGTWLWALHAHAQRHNRSLEDFREAIELDTEYLARQWREPCDDWWEERRGLNSATLASVYAGLKSVNHPDAESVRQTIGFEDVRTDGSQLACGLFEAVTPEDFAPVLQRIESELVSPGGGVHRYADDGYYGGGEWLLLTGMISQYYAKLGRHDEAIKKLEWITAHAWDNGWLPEQAADHLCRPEDYQHWVDDAGPSASPLLWSHATLITAVYMLG